MTGQITVTTVLDGTAGETAGTLSLTWTGGGGLYRVFRSDNPAFTGTGTVILTPGGITQMSISDTAQPPSGSAAFYLVMNQF